MFDEKLHRRAAANIDFRCGDNVGKHKKKSFLSYFVPSSLKHSQLESTHSCFFMVLALFVLSEFMALGNGFTEWNLYFRWSLNKRHLNHIRWTIFYFDFYCTDHSSFPLPADSEFYGWGKKYFFKNLNQVHLMKGGLSSSPSEKVEDSEEERFSFSSPFSPSSPCSSNSPLQIFLLSPLALSHSSFLLVIFFFSSVTWWGKANATFVCGDNGRGGGPPPICKKVKPCLIIRRAHCKQHKKVKIRLPVLIDLSWQARSNASPKEGELAYEIFC